MKPIDPFDGLVGVVRSTPFKVDKPAKPYQPRRRPTWAKVLLDILGTAAQPLSAADIAKKAGVSPYAVSGILRNSIKRGQVVIRRVDPVRVRAVLYEKAQ